MPILPDCANPLALTEYTGEAICDESAGISELYISSFDMVDWEATTTAMVEGKIATYTMEQGGLFVKLDFDGENAFYNATMTQETNFYEVLATFFMLGNTKAQLDAIQSMFGKCLIAHLFLVNCTERVIGVDQNANGIIRPIRRLKVGRHLDASGQLGQGDFARHEFDLNAKQRQAPLYANVGVENIPIEPAV